MKQKIACVYLIENLTNGKKYIGQSIEFNKRKTNHKCDSKRIITPLYNAIRKDGWENFEYTILMKDQTINYDKLDFWECYFIELFDTLNREKGYNLESGGNKNKNLNPETKAKLKIAQNKNKHFLGKKHTEEAKKKIGDSKRGTNNHFYGKKYTIEMKTELGLGTGKLYKEVLSHGKLVYKTYFMKKGKCITIEKYPNLGIPLIICTRICMENEIDFKSNLVKDIENFVQKIDLKTINFIN